MLDLVAQQLFVQWAPLIPFLHDSSPIPHLSQVEVVLSPQEQLMSIRQLLARFPSQAIKLTHAPTISFLVQHAICTGEATPINMVTCRRSPLDHNRINVVVTNMLAKGTQMGTFVSSINWTISKKRFYVDFRPLNKVLIRDFYPLPRVDDP